MEYFRSGNTLIVFVKGTTFQKTFANGEEVEDILDQLDTMDDPDLVDVAELFSYSNESEIKQLMESKERVKIEANIVQLMGEIKANGHKYIEVRDNKVYAKGINIAMPEVLVREFMERVGDEEDTKSLIKFWSLACLNPDARTRDKLFEFCKTHGITLTDKGYLVVYRNAAYKNKKTKQESSNELVDYVNARYADLRAKKKGTGNYYVVDLENGDYTLTTDSNEDNVVGNLKELFTKYQCGDWDIDNNTSEEVYTDQYSRSTTIKIGQPVALNESQIDTNPENECSRGLHVAGEKWLSRNYFGEVGLVCLVNPMNVRAIPYADLGKMRVKEYMPIGKAVYDEDGKIIPLDVKTFQHIYETITADEVLEMLKNLVVIECLNTYNIPTEINSDSLKTIFNNISEINPEDLRGRTEWRVKFVNG
jgi:hypothetical protein